MSPPRSVVLAKRRKVLEGATRMFFDLGYDAMTIDALIAEVGGSKTYISSAFGGKEKLFEAVVRNACDEILRPLISSAIDQPDLRKGLAIFAQRFLQLSLSEKSISLHRLVIGERLRFPQLGQIFLESGPEMTFQLVATYISYQQELGHVRAGDSHEFAVEFLGLLNAGFQQRMLLGAGGMPSRKHLSRRIDGALDIFIRGVTP